MQKEERLNRYEQFYEIFIGTKEGEKKKFIDWLTFEKTLFVWKK